MHESTINAAGLTITLCGEERTIATVTIGGREYCGEVRNPVGTDSPDQWMDASLLAGLHTLTPADFGKVCAALAVALC